MGMKTPKQPDGQPPKDDVEESTGLEDYGYWWEYVRQEKEQRPAKDPPFRRGRIW